MRTGNLNVYVPVDKVTWIQGKDKLKVCAMIMPSGTRASSKLDRWQSYQYLHAFRNFCPECGIQMTITLTDPIPNQTEIVALNVRAFQDIDYEKIKIVYVDMKDEGVVYDVDAIPQP